MANLLVASNKFGSSLVIISITPKLDYDTTERLQQYRQDHGITWTIARDTESVYSKYGVTLYPTIVLVDKDGYKRYTHIGLTEESVLSTEIREIPEFPELIIPILFMILAFIVVGSKKIMQPQGKNLK